MVKCLCMEIAHWGWRWPVGWVKRMWVDRDKSSWLAPAGGWLWEGNRSAGCWQVAQSDSKVCFLAKSGARSNVFLTSVIWLCGECSLWVIGFFFDLGKLAGSLSTLEDSCLMLWNTIKPNLGCIKDWQTCHLREVFVAGASHQQTARVVSTSSALCKNDSAEAEGLFPFPRLFNRKLGGIKPF